MILAWASPFKNGIYKFITATLRYMIFLMETFIIFTGLVHKQRHI